jgi:hypothetical protein
MLNNQLVVRTLEAIKDEAEAVEDRSDAQVMTNTRACGEYMQTRRGPEKRRTPLARIEIVHAVSSILHGEIAGVCC